MVCWNPISWLGAELGYIKHSAVALSEEEDSIVVPAVSVTVIGPRIAYRLAVWLGSPNSNDSNRSAEGMSLRKARGMWG